MTDRQLLEQIFADLLAARDDIDRLQRDVAQLRTPGKKDVLKFGDRH